MAERVEKQRLMDRLRKAGLWEEAEAFREETRHQLRVEGKTKTEAVSEAWDAMAAKYLPLVEQAGPPFQTILPDDAECFDDLVDPEYSEADDAVQMCDVYRWLKAEFHRVVSDRPAGTVVDYRLFRTPPPQGLACSILETWAAKPRDKRDGLFREIRVSLATTAVKAEDDSEEVDTSEADAILAALEEEEHLAPLEEGA